MNFRAQAQLLRLTLRLCATLLVMAIGSLGLLAVPVHADEITFRDGKVILRFKHVTITLPETVRGGPSINDYFLLKPPDFKQEVKSYYSGVEPGQVREAVRQHYKKLEEAFKSGFEAQYMTVNVIPEEIGIAYSGDAKLKNKPVGYILGGFHPSESFIREIEARTENYRRWAKDWLPGLVAGEGGLAWIPYRIVERWNEVYDLGIWQGIDGIRLDINPATFTPLGRPFYFQSPCNVDLVPNKLALCDQSLYWEIGLIAELTTDPIYSVPPKLFKDWVVRNHAVLKAIVSKN